MADYHQILQQHREILAHVRQLDHLIGPESRGLIHARVRQLLRQHLDALRIGLAEHFAVEEEGGYLSFVQAARPDLDRRISALQAQHSAILDNIDQALQRMPHATLEVIKSDIADNLRTLRRHEETERSLIEMATLQELGTAD